MKYHSSISSKGQVTVPQEIRVRLGLQPGDRVEFVTDGPNTLIRPARANENPFDEYVGILGTFPGGIPEINAWVRDMRDEEEEKK
jgi:AbrB family looped-hinge helix DNA binding protein